MITWLLYQEHLKGSIKIRRSRKGSEIEKREDGKCCHDEGFDSRMSPRRDKGTFGNLSRDTDFLGKTGDP